MTRPNGFDQDATYQSETSNPDGTVTATYDLQHDSAHAVFAPSDNGTYRVSTGVDKGANDAGSEHDLEDRGGEEHEC